MSNEKVTVTVESATAALDHVWGGPGWLPDDLRKAYASSYGNRPGLKIPTGVIIAIHEITIVLTQRGDFSGLTGLWEPEGILRRAATRGNGATYLTVHAAEALLEQIRQTPTTIEPERNIPLDGDDEDNNPRSPKTYAQGSVPSADSLVDEGQYLLEGAKLLHQGVIAEYGSHNNNLPKIQKRLAKARKELSDVRTKIDKLQLILVGKQYHEKAQQALVECLGFDEATARAKNWFELLA